MGQSQKHYTEWKQPVSEGYMQKDFIYMTVSKRQIIVKENIPVVARSYGWEKLWLQRDSRWGLGSGDTVLYPIYGNWYKEHIHVKITVPWADSAVLPSHPSSILLWTNITDPLERASLSASLGGARSSQLWHPLCSFSFLFKPSPTPLPGHLWSFLQPLDKATCQSPHSPSFTAVNYHYTTLRLHTTLF